MFSKGLYGLYDNYQTVNDTSTDLRLHVGAIWPDMIKGKYRYFGAKDENEALRLFKADKKYKSKIKYILY